MQAQELGKLILRRGRDLRSRQYGCGKLQAESNQREQVSRRDRRPRISAVHARIWSITLAGLRCRRLIHLRVSRQSDQLPVRVSRQCDLRDDARLARVATSMIEVPSGGRICPT